MLAELEDIVVKATGPGRESIDRDLRAAARALLDRQFVYSDDHQGKARFEIVRRHRAYFSDLFDALGYDLVVDEREQVAGIVSQSGAAPRRMTVNESLFLVALRAIHDERVRTFLLKEGGRCETTLGEVWTLIEERTGRQRPSSARCRQLVEHFRRNGLVRDMEDLPDGDLLLEVRPAIARAVTAATAEALEQWAEGGHASRGDPLDGDTPANEETEEAECA